MPQTANIQYFSAPGQPFEVILCENSTISYPLHNHVSVYTAGLVLQGAFFLGIGNSASICRPGRAFVIPPYRPHFIKAFALQPAKPLHSQTRDLPTAGVLAKVVG